MRGTARTPALTDRTAALTARTAATPAHTARTAAPIARTAGLQTINNENANFVPYNMLRGKNNL